MYTLFSVDDHIIEPAHVWTDHIAKKYRDRAPHVIEEEGRQYWVFNGVKEPSMGLNAVVGRPPQEWGTDPVRFSDMVPASYDPKERSKLMLSQGIVATMSFPQLAGFAGRRFIDWEDKELAAACVSAWNDFILDEWCAAEPGMFVPMVTCQLWDVDLAVREIRRCLDKGAKALCFVEDPAQIGLPTIHTDYWDPLYATCQEADMPICMHIGSAGTPIDSTGKPLDSRTTPMVIMATTFSSATRGAANYMCSPVPRKFPDIKLVWSEGGVGWVPHALERADQQWVKHKFWTKLDDTLPSEIARKNMWFCVIDEPIGFKARHDFDTSHILFEDDFPHADTLYPNTQRTVEALFADVSPEVTEAITHGNAEKLFHFPVSPELVAKAKAMQPDLVGA